jgi:ABC-2 type transport system ATP-binding protein
VSEGRITVFGEPVRDNPELYRRIGVLQEHDSFYPFMTGRKFVRMMAKLRGAEDPDGAALKAIEEVDLLTAMDRPMGTYSRGMKQRMRLAATIAHDPELLILDEPLNGADPRQRVHFQRLLRQQADAGRTILVSSHILEEIETLADTVLLVVNGKLAAAGDYRAIRAALDKRPYHVRVACSSPRELAGALIGLDDVDAVNIDDDGGLVILSRNVASLQLELPRAARERNVRLLRVEPLDDSLESVFGYLVEG